MPSRPGEQIELELEVTAPRPPGRLPARVRSRRGEPVLVRRGRRHARSSSTIEVAPRIDARTLAVEVHGGARSGHERRARRAGGAAVARGAMPSAVAHLVAGAIPPPEWSRIAPRRARRGLGGGRDGVDRHWPRPRARRPGAAGGGRNPRFDQPLLLPSLLAGIEPTTHLGLPAYAGDDGLFDGSVAVTLPRRSGRRPT